MWKGVIVVQLSQDDPQTDVGRGVEGKSRDHGRCLVRSIRRGLKRSRRGMHGVLNVRSESERGSVEEW